MGTTRTNGMTTVGIFNIVVGSLGTLVALLVVVGGGLLAVGGAAMESELGAEAEGMGATAAVGGGIILVIGLVAVAAWSMLAVSGIGILKMAPWGRTLSIVCGVLLVLMNGFSILQGVGLLNLAFLAYGGTLVYMMFGPWKAAFTGGDSITDGLSDFQAETQTQDQDFRTAA